MPDNRSFFYKYTSMETALKVVDSLSFRWSSPVHFNDPFDNQTGFRKSFTSEEFSSAIRDLFHDVAIHKVSLTPRYTTALTPLIHLLNSLPNSDKTHQLLKELEPAFTETSSNLNRAFSDLNMEIIKSFLHSRIFCVSETNSSPAMWAHYADNYKGVVFKLACIAKIDNPLNAAKKVKYSKSFPEFPSLDDYMKDLTGEIKLDLKELAAELAYWKHTDWEYEQEWRVIYPMLNEPHGDGYKTIKENPQIFEAIYIGAKADPELTHTLASLASNKLPAMKFYKAEPSKDSFGFNFIPFGQP